MVLVLVLPCLKRLLSVRQAEITGMLVKLRLWYNVERYWEVVECLSRVNEILQPQNQWVVFLTTMTMSLNVLKRFQLYREINVLGWLHRRWRYRSWTKQYITFFCRIITNGNLIMLEDLSHMSWAMYLQIYSVK